MTAARTGVLALAAVLAVVLQASVLPGVAVRGVVPDLVLLVVVAAGLARGPEHAALLGLGAGLLLDLAPPADHVAGRWALALVVVGWVAGRVRQGSRPTPTTVVLTVAACSFLGTSLFALSGLVLQDGAPVVTAMLPVVLIALAWDVVLTPVVLPPLLALLARLDARGAGVPARLGPPAPAAPTAPTAPTAPPGTRTEVPA